MRTAQPGQVEGQIGALRLIKYGNRGYVEQLCGLDDSARSMCVCPTPPELAHCRALRLSGLPCLGVYTWTALVVCCSVPCSSCYVWSRSSIVNCLAARRSPPPGPALTCYSDLPCALSCCLAPFKLLVEALRRRCRGALGRLCFVVAFTNTGLHVGSQCGRSWARPSSVQTNSGSIAAVRVLCRCIQPQHTVLHQLNASPWPALDLVRLYAQHCSQHPGYHKARRPLAHCFAQRSYVLGVGMQHMSAPFAARRSWRIVSHQLNTNPYPAAFLNYRATIRLAEVTIEGSTFVECASTPPGAALDGACMSGAVSAAAC